MIFRSFYARISLIFLFLILLLAGISLLIGFNASRHLFDEVEQLLNREYAESIAVELRPLVEEGFSLSRIQDAIHYMMVLNPMVEIYLIADDGTIMAYFTHPNEEIIQPKISTEPLDRFIASGGWEIVSGDDPRTRDKKKPFSAAPLAMGEDRGYVYVILRGQSYDRSLASVGSNYYLRTGLFAFLFAFLATLIAGFSLFFLLTRRLRALASGVRIFEQGRYDHRIPVRGNDEISSLTQAFNDMAGSVDEAVRKLHQAEKQRSDLIANISHDLRSPLTSIRGHLETLIMKDQNLEAPQRREFLDTILKNVSSFQKLVEELFDLARLEARQVTPEFLRFSLAELVQDVVLKLKPLRDSRSIAVLYRQQEDPVPVRGDITLLERLLTNVLENAIHHSPEEGRVEITLEEGLPGVEVCILDSGSGIAPEDLPHVFERFYRGDKSRSRGRPGTGLGLAIAREIAELHGGGITAENHRSGGALFRIKLPRD